MTRTFAYANEEATFIIKEGTKGTLQKLTAANKVYTVGPVDFGQELEFLEDEQIRETASRFSPIKARKLVGELSFTTYVKPSGTKGTAPEADVLFECLMGSKDVNTDVSVVYSLANQLDSFSLWCKKGHSVFAFRGVGLEGADFGIAGEEIANIAWSGKYFEQLWAGTATATGTYAASDTVINFAATEAERFCKDMYVTVGDDTNNDQGYKITAVNQAAKTITIEALTSNPSAAGINPTVAPWWPTASSEVGTPGHGKMGFVTIESLNAIVTRSTLNVANNLKFYEDEKNDKWTCESFVRPGRREIGGELELRFIKSGPSYFYRSEYQVSNALVIPVGNAAGYIMEITIPYAEYETSRLASGEEVMQTIPFKAIASATMNDEMALTFK